jgi:hypothetical protein
MFHYYLFAEIYYIDPNRYEVAIQETEILFGQQQYHLNI